MAKKKPRKASKKETAKTKKKLRDKEAKAKKKLLGKAARAEKKLRKYHALGQEILAACERANPDGKSYSKGVIQRFAEKLDRSREYCDKARQFAGVYDEDDLDILCDLRNSKKMPLSTDHVRKLLRVENLELREELQAEAADNDWGSKRFAAEITKRIGKSSEIRRGPTRPKTRYDALAHIEKMSDGWLRWFDGLQEPGDEKLGREAAALKNLPKRVQQELEETIPSIKRLLAEANKALKRKRKKQGTSPSPKKKTQTKAKRAKRTKSSKKRPKA